MREGISYVGVDAGKASLSIAVRFSGSAAIVEFTVPNEANGVRRTVRKIQREAPGPVRFCYEAGATGYALHRQVEALGSECMVVAPSLVPVRPGHRIKTDRRDARKLLEMFEAGLLTAVRPPTTTEESARDLVRCREDVLEDLSRCRHRLAKMLLRRGYVYRDGRAWTLSYRRWLRELKWERTTDQVVFEDYLLAIGQHEERLRALDGQLVALAQSEPYRAAMGVLGCHHGIAVVTAMTILTELHGWERFRSPRQLMAYLGLVPSEHSSSLRTVRGRITKAGNAHVRRVLIEAAHQFRHRPTVGPVLRRRREGQPQWAITLADRAQQRLHRRYRNLAARGKPYGKIIVAVARELVGFLWATLQQFSRTQLKAA